MSNGTWVPQVWQGRVLRHRMQIEHACLFQLQPVGHFKAEFPILNPIGAIEAPAPVTLRITNGCQGRPKSPRAKGRAFQLTKKEAKEGPVVVENTFLINSMLALVLFYYGESYSFILLRFCQNINHTIGDLNYLMRVEIFDDRMTNVSKVYHICTLEIGNNSFPINLFPIPMSKMSVIVGKDWLNHFEAMIDCRKKTVRVKTPSRGELTI